MKLVSIGKATFACCSVRLNCQQPYILIHIFKSDFSMLLGQIKMSTNDCQQPYIPFQIFKSNHFN